MTRFRSFLLWLVFGLTPHSPEALPTINTNRNCFTTPPGNASRGSVTLKLGVRNHLSHQLSSAMLEILLKEYMGYKVVAYDLTNMDAKAWGAEMAAGQYDIDVENVEATPDSEAYMKYITKDATVVDGGSTGYKFRKGFYVTPGIVASKAMSTWYMYYQSATNVKSSNFVMLADGHQSTCTEAWCGTGALKGFWGPSQCVATPADCAAALMEGPGTGDDLARFEQLTNNLKLNFIHAYLGSSFVSKIKAFAAAGKQVIFLADNLQPVVQELKVQRIEFPDYVPGCDSGSTRTPSGGISCDYGARTLRKLMHSRLRGDAAEAYYMLQKIQMYIDGFQSLIASTKAAGGTLTPYQAACAYLKDATNSATVKTWVPTCISNPPAVPVTGDLVFDFFSLSCKAVLAYPETPLPACYNSTTGFPGTVDRSKMKIKLCQQYWLSQRIATAVTAIILKDFLGHSVSTVDMSSGTTSMIYEYMDSGACNADMESWQASPAGAKYIEYVVSKRTILNPGDIGYRGVSSHYVTAGLPKFNKMANYWKYYTNQTDLKTVPMLRYGDAGKPGFPKTMQQYDTGFPSCNPAQQTWCAGQNPNPGDAGYWAPPWCMGSRATDCALVIHPVSSYDTAYFETLTHSLGLNFVYSYYGWGASSLIKDINKNGQNVVFYWWEPDPLHTSVTSKRLSYPDTTFGCDRDYTRDPVTGSLTCDYPASPLGKLVSPTIRDTMREAYFTMTKIKIRKEDVEEMMLPHTESGGTKNYDEVACDWVKKNEARIRKSFAPDCVSRPKSSTSLKIGDSVFDASKMECVTISCLPDQVIVAGESGVACKTCGSGLVPNAAKTDCVGCPVGSAPNRTLGTCSPCIKGYFCRYGSESPVPCQLGSFTGNESQLECSQCPKGSYSNTMASSACISCTSPMTTAQLGARKASECICPAKSYQPSNVTDAKGIPWSVGTTVCLPCPPGMSCVEASEEDNIPCKAGVYTASTSPGYTQRKYPVPLVGHYAMCQGTGPLSSYMCLSDEACPGGDVESCRPGTEGIACGRCQSEWYKNGHVCEKCNDVETSNGIFPILPIAFAPIAILLFYRASRDLIEKWNSYANQIAACLFVSLMYIQSLAAMQACYIAMPSMMTDSMGWTVYTYEMLSLLRPGCTTFSDFTASFVGKLLLPLYAFVGFLLVFLGSLVTGKIFGAGLRMNGYVVMNCYCACFNTFFIGIAQQTLTLFQCYNHPNGEKSLRSQADVICGGDEWTSVLAVAIVCALIFCLGFLGLVFYLIWVAPSQFNNETFRMKWKFLFIKFRPSCYWWGLILLFKGIWMNLPTVVFDYGTGQVLWLMSLLLLYLVCSIAFLPWRTFSIGCLDVLMHITLCYIFVLATHFVDMGGNDDDGLEYSMAGISVTPIAIGAILFFYLLYRRFASPAKDDSWTNSAQACIETFSSITSTHDLGQVLKNLPFTDLTIINSAKKILDTEFDQHYPGLKKRHKSVSNDSLMGMMSRERLSFDKAASQKEVSNGDVSGRISDGVVVPASEEDVKKNIQSIKDNLKPDDAWLCTALELAATNQSYEASLPAKPSSDPANILSDDTDPAWTGLEDCPTENTANVFASKVPTTPRNEN